MWNDGSGVDSRALDEVRFVADNVYFDSVTDKSFLVVLEAAMKSVSKPTEKAWTSVRRTEGVPSSSATEQEPRA